MLSIRQQYRHALVDWIASGDYTFFVTLNLNCDANFQRIRSLLKDFFAHLDRKHLGRNWSRQESAHRFNAICCAEHLESNAHVHLLLGLPSQLTYLQLSELQNHVAEIWSKLIKSGSSDVRPAYDRWGAANYLTKELLKSANDKFILAAEFHHFHPAKVIGDSRPLPPLGRSTQRDDPKTARRATTKRR